MMATKLHRANPRVTTSAAAIALRDLTRLPGTSVIAVDVDGCITAASGSFPRALGRGEHALRGELFALALPELPAVDAALRGALDGDASTRLTDLAGVPVELRACPLLTSGGSIDGAIAIGTEARTLAAAEERLRSLERTDELTALPGAGALERVTASAASEATSGNAAALVRFRVLDGELVEAAHGPVRREELIRAVGARVRGALTTDVFVAFLGGCDFAVLQRGLPGDGRAGGRALVESIRATLAEPFDVAGVALVPRLVTAAAAAPKDTTDPDRMLALADEGMPGRSGGGDPERELILRTRLPGAVRRDELELVYQPIFDLRLRTATAVEGLLRWHDPVLGTVPPATFIPIARETGLMYELGAWALDELLMHAMGWRAAGVSPLDLHLNLSGEELARPRAADEILASVKRAGISAKRVVFEVRAADLVEHPGAGGSIQRLRAAGARIALDDFGTASSPLTVLAQTPVDVLKLDRALVGAVATSAEARTIVSAICAMARALDVVVVAVGIEDDAAVRMLTDLGCFFGQGFALARPAAASPE